MIQYDMKHSPDGVAPYNEVHNQMLLNTMYEKGYDKESGEYTDILYIVTKNTDTNKKDLQIIKHPTIPVYFEKKEYRDHDYIKRSEVVEKLEEREIPYADIPRHSAEDWGEKGKALYDVFRTNKDNDAMNSLLLNPYIFGADYTPDIIYRVKWLERYGLSNTTHFKVFNGFADIETSLLNTRNECDPSRDVIDMVSIVNDATKEVHTFLFFFEDLLFLDGESNEEFNKRKELWEQKITTQRWILDHKEEATRTVHEFFQEEYPEFRFFLHIYTDELQMIRSFFQYVNDQSFDNVLFWNISFDMPYFIDRITALGGKPADIICPDNFPIKKVYFSKDYKHKEIKTNNDRINCTSMTSYICQQRVYVKTRRASKEYRFSSLNYIAEVEGVSGKLDHSDAGNLLNLSTKDYLRYILYNIKDVLTQHDIEHRTNDTLSLQVSSYMFATPYKDCFSNSVINRNAQYYYFEWLLGRIPGVNANAIEYNRKRKELMNRGIDPDEYEKKHKEKFEGAAVGNVELISNVGKKILGQPSNCYFGASIDMDMKAFYPNGKIANNISPDTMIFKVQIRNDLFNNYVDKFGNRGMYRYRGITDRQLVESNKDFFFKDGDIAKEIMDNYSTGNVLAFGYKWLNLPSVLQMTKMIERDIKNGRK